MVVLNKSFYYFHLTRTGWVSTLSDKEIAFDDALAPVGSMLLLQITEYSHDERPDIWHRAEIVDVCEMEDRSELQKCFEQYPLPKLVEDKCWMQIVQLKQAMGK